MGINDDNEHERSEWSDTMKPERFMSFAIQLVEKVIPEMQQSHHVDARDRIVTLAKDGCVCLYARGHTPKWDVVAKDWTAVDFDSDAVGTVTVVATSVVDLKMPKGDYSQCIWFIGED